MKINRWPRIGGIIFLLWAVLISAYTWNQIDRGAGERAKYSQEYCASENKEQPTTLDCRWDYDQHFQHARQLLILEWRVITPVIILVPPVIIFLMWLCSYGVVKILYWIAPRFFKTEKTSSPLRMSFILCAMIIFIYVLCVIIFNVSAPVGIIL